MANKEKKYEVPVKIIFEGTVKVIGENRVEARKNVDNNFNAIIGQIGDNTRDDLILDWDIDTHNTELEYGRILRLE